MKNSTNKRRNGLGTLLLTSVISLAPLNDSKAQERNEDQDPGTLVRQVGYGHLAARTLQVACYFKLFDSLQRGPKSSEQMVNGTPYNPNVVKRLMRVLANHRMVEMDDLERFSLNANSKILVSTAPDSLQPAMAKEFMPARWQAIGSIHVALTDNLIPFNHVLGMSFYDYIQQDEEAARLFNVGMKNFSEREDEEVSSIKLFEKFESYCDIGGGTGGLISRILAKNLHLKGILFDLPDTVKACELPNVIKEGGSFFETIPSAEVFTLKRVIHNWDDQKSTTILNNTTRALSDQKKGRVLIIEKVLAQSAESGYLADSDVIALTFGGIERTLGEFIKLGRSAGLELEDQILLPSGVSVLVFKTMQK